MPGYSYPDSASVPVVCLCVWRVGILTSTLASQKRSNPEENIEELPQFDSEGAPSTLETADYHQSQHHEHLLPFQLDLPCVPLPSVPIPSLPPLPPCSPTPSSFPFPPGDCQLSDINLTPGNDRQSVLRCPTSQGYSCSPGVIGDRLAVTPSVCRLPTEDTPQTLTWDNYKDSPTFSLSNTWTVATGHSLWSELGAVRPYIASSTDPFVIDSDSDLLDGIERLRSDNEPVRKVELVSTDCSSLARSPVFGDSFEEENTYEIVAVGVSEAVAEMNQDKNNELRQQHEDLQDEIDDLDPASVTRETTAAKGGVG